MMSDHFLLNNQDPSNQHHATIVSRDESYGRNSLGSFVPSLNDNFGDWGSFSNSKESLSNKDDDFDFPNRESDKIVDGFGVITSNPTERKNVPKLPHSQREVRKVVSVQQYQPSIVIETGNHGGDMDFSISPMTLASSMTTSMMDHKKDCPEPNRHISRSVSDVGSLGNSKKSYARDSDLTLMHTPPAGLREKWQAAKGSSISMPFSHRRKSFTNRLQTKGVGEKIKSKRNVYQGLEGDEPQPQNQTVKGTSERRNSKKNMYQGLEEDEPQSQNKPVRGMMKRRESKRSLYQELEGDEPQPQNQTVKGTPERRNSKKNLYQELEEDEPQSQNKPVRGMKRRESKRSLYQELEEDEPQPQNKPVRGMMKRRESKRSLYQELDEDEPRPQNQAGDDDGRQDSEIFNSEMFEGTVPLKTTPTIAVKKRASSKSRLANRSAARTSSTPPDETEPTTDEFGPRQPSRRASSSSRSTASGGRRPRRIKSIRSDSKGRTRQKNEATGYNCTPSPTGKITKSSMELINEILEVGARRSKSSKRIKEKENPDSSTRLSSSGRNLMGDSNGIHEAHISCDEIKKYSSRMSSRRTACSRMISMTGSITDTIQIRPKDRRRTSMDHYKSTSPSRRPKDRFRRASMDHYVSTSPSDVQRERKKAALIHITSNSLSEYPRKSSSKSDFVKSMMYCKNVPASGDKERGSLPGRIPFGEDGTVSTEEESSTTNPPTIDTASNNPPSRKSSITSLTKSRGRAPPRKSKSGTEGSQRGFSLRRSTARTKSDLGKPRQQRYNQQTQGQSDKSVTVEEILAVLASTPSSRELNYEDRSNRSLTKGGSTSGRSLRSNRSGHRERSHSRSREGAPREKSRSKSRTGMRRRASGSGRLRKVKRDDRQSKSKPVVTGKESRRNHKGRRASAL